MSFPQACDFLPPTSPRVSSHLGTAPQPWVRLRGQLYRGPPRGRGGGWGWGCPAFGSVLVDVRPLWGNSGASGHRGSLNLSILYLPYPHNFSPNLEKSCFLRPKIFFGPFSARFSAISGPPGRGYWYRYQKFQVPETIIFNFLVENYGDRVGRESID